MGLEPAVHDGSLAAAAQAHATYVAATNEYGHSQSQPDHPDFTGANLAARMEAAGVSWDTSFEGGREVVAFHEAGADPTLAVDLWMDTVYHREPLTTPGPVEVGFGSEGIYSVMVLLSPWESEGEALFGTYPAQGQGDARGAFDSDVEVPDPVPHLGVVGVPITLTALAPLWLSDEDPYGMRIEPNGTHLQSLGGEERELILLEPASESSLLRTIAAIPTEPLPPRSTWNVTFVFSLGGTMNQQTWSFATGP